ncbi:MAG: TonB-dependent receptor [Cytophagaceae bacterium]|nr:TonB-dependent receptor [Cytophagaceae bacterium]
MEKIYGITSTGLYGQDELSALDNAIRLTAALRYTEAKSIDAYTIGDADDKQITPRIGLSVSITRNTTIYGLYDKAFIPQPGADFYGNRFRPITEDNIEAGIKKDWFDERWNTSVSVYQLTKNGAITSDLAHPFMSIQLDGQTKSKGVEFDLRGEVARGLNLILNYAYQDFKVSKHENAAFVGVATPGSVSHVAAGWLSYEFQASALKAVGLSLGYTYQADRSACYSFGGEKFSLPDYFKLDGAIS